MLIILDDKGFKLLMAQGQLTLLQEFAQQNVFVGNQEKAVNHQSLV